MKTSLEIRTARILLRRLRAEDLDAFLDYRNDPDVHRYDGLHGITPEEAQAFIAQQAISPVAEPGTWLQIGIELQGRGLIGDLGFRVDDAMPDTAEIGYRLGRQWWGRGYASEATGGVLSWAFDELGLHRVVALIDTRNTRSVALVERLGFRREGHLVESYKERAGWSDEYLYALLEREWKG